MTGLTKNLASGTEVTHLPLWKKNLKASMTRANCGTDTHGHKAHVRYVFTEGIDSENGTMFLPNYIRL